ncbi:MAG TPA: GTP cyclohydrolase II [Polyangiaceae bacterium]|jgi:GTP cyclohydrolase II|nr:GTP cyclohydrolase II [Polyangiaceae bacterium]
MYVANQAIRPLLRIRAEAKVPTRFGEFSTIVFNFGRGSGNEPAGEEGSIESNLSPDHVALVMGDVRGKSGVLCRVHSECLTSEVFGSLKCDCKEQLENAQQEIAARGFGVVLYLRQEGRGIGLANKIRAYQLQSVGHDTVDANRILELPDDAREYDGAASMLEYLGVESIELLTNNPTKVEALRSLGVEVHARKPSLIRPNPFSKNYLEAKRLRMNHVLPAYDNSDGA